MVMGFKGALSEMEMHVASDCCTRHHARAHLSLRGLVHHVCAVCSYLYGASLHHLSLSGSADAIRDGDADERTDT